MPLRPSFVSFPAVPKKVMALGTGLLFGIALGWLTEPVKKNFPFSEILTLTSVGALVISAAAVLLLYLDNPFRRKSDVSTSGRDVRLYQRHFDRKLEQALGRVQELEDAIGGLSLPESRKDEIKKDILQRIAEMDIRQMVFESVEQVVTTKQDQREIALHRLCEELVLSLERQIYDLGRRSNLNLVIGMLTTIVGLAIMGYFVFYSPVGSFYNLDAGLIYFATRLTLVIFIEVFAYFFLRLYRYSIFEIKFFQNEVTNVRLKILALNVSSERGREETLNKVCIELAQTERNFVLKKGETTISLKRDELEARADKSLVQLIDELIRARERQ